MKDNFKTETVILLPPRESSGLEHIPHLLVAVEMTKKMKNLEKEVIMWCTKWENNNKILLEMAEEKTVHDKEYRVFQIKLERLEKLYRALQMERNELNEKVQVLKEKRSV
ncbi:TPA: lipopolysaccaride-specific response 5-like protein-like [Bos taurus]|nr:TPA: lipopolysaccaride-specific response 5-like protein-like [Bos taurus]